MRNTIKIARKKFLNKIILIDMNRELVELVSVMTKGNF